MKNLKLETLFKNKTHLMIKQVVLLLLSGRGV